MPGRANRGCRLAILHPEIYEMQVRAIMRAARAVNERLGHVPLLEVMIPLIDYERELEIIEELIFAIAEEEGDERAADVDRRRRSAGRSCTRVQRASLRCRTQREHQH